DGNIGSFAFCRHEQRWDGGRGRYLVDDWDLYDEQRNLDLELHGYGFRFRGAEPIGGLQLHWWSAEWDLSSGGRQQQQPDGVGWNLWPAGLIHGSALEQ